MLSLQFLGTGGAFTRYDVNYHNNAIIKVDNKIIMIDCGSTAPQALHELSIKPWEIDAVLLTHMHGDHCGGLEQLIWERYYTGPNGPGFMKTPIYCASRLKMSLISYLGQVLDPYTTQFGKTSDSWKEHLVDIRSKSNEFHPTGITPWVTFHSTTHVKGDGHNKPAYGIEIRNSEKMVYYSGDTTFDMETLIKFSDAETIFHECMFFPAYPGTVHTHYEQLKTVPSYIRKKIVLMHHTRVPDDVDVKADGFLCAANRFQEFQF